MSQLNYGYVEEFFSFLRQLSPYLREGKEKASANNPGALAALASALEEFRMAVTNLPVDEENVQRARQLLQTSAKAALGQDTFIGLLQKVKEEQAVVAKGRMQLDRGANHFSLTSPTMEEVVPGLFVGSYHPANDRDLLKRHNVTHICCCINVQPRFPLEFNYMTIPADDSMSYNITPYFNSSFDFIDKAIVRGEGVLVHCGAGISRAPTITASYLIRKLRIPAATAIAMIKKSRSCASPNPNFVSQLTAYQKELLVN